MVAGRGGDRAFLAAALAFAIGCGDDATALRLPPIVWQSTHFRYAAWPDDTGACADVTDVLEEHWTFWHDRLGLPDPGRPEILYAKARGPSELLDDEWCSGTAAGCTTGTEIRAYLLFDKHELIHAYLAETMPPPAPLFAEGAAVAFSCDAGFPPPDTLPPWRDLLNADPADPVSYAVYPVGGQLVSLLYSRFGGEAFVRFYAAIGPLTDPDAIAEAFQSAFGTALDDVWPDVPSTPLCLALWECTRPPIPLDGTPHTAGLLCGRNLVMSTIRVTTQVNVAATLRNAPSNLSFSPACRDSTAPGTLSLWPGGDFTLLADLAPGTYVVNLGDGEMTASPTGAPSVGTSCAGLVPYPVAADDARVVVAAASRQAFARVRFADARAGVLVAERDESAWSVLWSCPDCATPPSSCPQVGDVDIRGTFQGEYVWNMQNQRTGWASAYFHDPP